MRGGTQTVTGNLGNDSPSQWIHPDDEYAISTHRHSLNLDYPVSPFVGNILDAPIIVDRL